MMWAGWRKGVVRTLEWAVILMVAAMTLTVLWGVFTRSILQHQASFTDELARLLLVWIAMIGGALAFGEKAHLGVDFFVGLIDPSARKAVSVAVQVVTLGLAAAVFMHGGWRLAMSQMGQILPTIPWLTRGVVYFSIPLAGFFITIFALENLVEILRTPAEKLGAQTKAEG